MPSRCCVKNCNSGSRENPVKLSMFKPPCNQELWDSWEAVLKVFKTTLKKSSYVCEKHFLPEEIKRISIFKGTDGQLVEKTLNNPRLRPGAIPSIFDWDESLEINYQTEESLNSNNHADFQDKELQNKNHRKPHVLNIGNSSLNDDNFDDYTNNQQRENSTEFSKKEKTSILSMNYVTFEKGQTINNIFVKEVHSNSDEDENLEESNFDSSFDTEMVSDDIVQEKNKKIDISSSLITEMKLPNGWTLTKINPDELAFIKITFVSTNEEPLIIERQIILQKDGGLKIKIFNKLVNVCKDIPRTIADLNKFINMINDLKLCKGGPNKNIYKNLVSQSGFIDQSNNWRHNNCDVIINNEETCKYCLKLNTAFQKYSKLEESVHEDVNELCFIPSSLEELELSNILN